MCVPPKKQRDKQKDTPVPQTLPQNIVKACMDEKHILVRLEVTGAVQVAGKSTAFWEVQNDNLTIPVKAITSPDTPGVWPEIVWNTGGVNADCNIVEVSRSGPMEMRVAARLNTPYKYVDIFIYDLTALNCPLPVKLNDRDQHWKAYEQNKTITLTAVTVPDEASVWSLLQWSQAANANQCDVSLAAAGEKHVTVSLGQTGPKKLVADIHVCKWPKLEINQVSFDSYSVFNDGAAEIDKEFDSLWKKGRPDPATNVATASCQSPLCYVSGAAISLSAQFKVTQAPTDPETVDVKGTAVVGGTTIVWKGQVTVDPKSKYVDIAGVAGDQPLPKGVACLDPMEIKWSMIEADHTTWTQIGSSKNLLYVLLGAPRAKLYWTLLDISCRAAAGKTTEADFVPAAFAPFTTHTGDGKGFKRKSDGVDLSYYKQGVNTSGDQAEPSVYSTFGILSRPDGTGRCGGWANLLIHLFEMHGVNSAGQLWFIRGKDKNNADMSLRFLVKNCTFTGGGTKPAPYPYIGDTDCKKQNGVAGQGKTNPQFDFGDHVVVSHGGKIYDPSYGVGPKASQLEYEQAAMDGLGTMKFAPKYVSFTHSDGTPQFISGRCSPGFVAHAVTGGEKLSAIAATYGTTESALFNHAYNQALKALRVTADKIQDGDVVYIPRSSTMTMLDGHYL
jgi:hypothetical protein